MLKALLRFAGYRPLAEDIYRLELLNASGCSPRLSIEVTENPDFFGM